MARSPHPNRGGPRDHFQRVSRCREGRVYSRWVAREQALLGYAAIGEHAREYFPSPIRAQVAPRPSVFARPLPTLSGVAGCESVFSDSLPAGFGVIVVALGIVSVVLVIMQQWGRPAMPAD